MERTWEAVTSYALCPTDPTCFQPRPVSQTAPNHSGLLLTRQLPDGIAAGGPEHSLKDRRECSNIWLPHPQCH